MTLINWGSMIMYFKCVILFTYHINVIIVTPYCIAMYCNKNRIALSEIIPQSRELDILRKVTLNKKVWILIIVCHGNCMLKINDGKEI